jgi:hypothetical protein
MTTESVENTFAPLVSYNCAMPKKDKEPRKFSVADQIKVKLHTGNVVDATVRVGVGLGPHGLLPGSVTFASVRTLGALTALLKSEAS